MYVVHALHSVVRGSSRASRRRTVLADLRRGNVVAITTQPAKPPPPDRERERRRECETESAKTYANVCLYMLHVVIAYFGVQTATVHCICTSYANKCTFSRRRSSSSSEQGGCLVGRTRACLVTYKLDVCANGTNRRTQTEMQMYW